MEHCWPATCYLAAPPQLSCLWRCDVLKKIPMFCSLRFFRYPKISIFSQTRKGFPWYSLTITSDSPPLHCFCFGPIALSVAPGTNFKIFSKNPENTERSTLTKFLSLVSGENRLCGPIAYQNIAQGGWLAAAYQRDCSFPWFYKWKNMSKLALQRFFFVLTKKPFYLIPK